MRQYLAAALAIAVSIGPASAVDVGVGGKVGGIGAGAGLGVDSNGASVGVGTSVDGVGGADVGGAVDTSRGSPGANVGAGANLGDVSGGVSAGLDAGDESAGGGATPGDTTSGVAGAAIGGTAAPTSVGAGKKTAAIVVTKGVRYAIVLPRSLWPSKGDRNAPGPSTKGYPMLLPPVPIPGTPPAVVRVCRQAIMSAATPLGAVRVDAASAGPVRRHRRGALTAPIEVRIDYARQGGIEVRQARVVCRLDAAGRVVAVK
ncbi:helicase [Mesorhizobium sp. AR10]|nr:helicase [Mesorhizobium sp. AR10]